MIEKKIKKNNFLYYIKKPISQKTVMDQHAAYTALDALYQSYGAIIGPFHPNREYSQEYYEISNPGWEQHELDE